MIERQNIITLLSDRTNVYHSALLTTYCFDPIYFESVYLSTLRKLGITNIVVLMDANMYDQLITDANYQCHRVSQLSYTLVRQENRHSGVFHPKMVLLFGEEEGVFILGSGNLTYSGLTNNEEVWSVFHISGSESLHYPLFYKAWKYLSDATSSASSLVRRQIEWMHEQSPWLKDEDVEDVVKLQSGEECQLLFNSTEATILNSIYATVGDNKIDEITVIAPFYDTEGTALKELQKHFSPTKMRCVMDLERQSAPYALLRRETSIAFFKSSALKPLHAKIIEIRSKDETWILCGSANAGNMALGINSAVFNDEACVFLHCIKKKNYIKSLGVEFEPLTTEEKKSIERPNQAKLDRAPLAVKLVSCEEKERKLFLRFSKPGVEGSLSILDKAQNTIFASDISTNDEVTVDVDNVNVDAMHIVVLKRGDEEISNRVLIIREAHVESCNPDPKRRKLTSLLDDDDLLENLEHILGYIEFDEEKKTHKTIKATVSSKVTKDNDDVIVTRDRFNELKDTTLSINMHSGVRILNYLRQLFFKNEETEQLGDGDDALLNLGEDGGEKDDKKDKDVIEDIKSKMSDASQYRRQLIRYLERMLGFLMKKVDDESIQGEITPAVGRAKLMAVPGLNAASSFAVAASSLLFLMNKYSDEIYGKKYLQELFFSVAGRFISIYANMLPSEETLRNRKIIEMLKGGTVDALVAICFFSYPKGEKDMPLLVLNSLEMWKGRNELNEIMPLFEQQLQKMNPDAIVWKTVDKVRYIAEVYLSKETPIEEFSKYVSCVYQLRKGYGFLLIENITFTSKGWRYSYSSPCYEDKVDNISSSKFKGYFDFDL